jgi:4-diphosphocytidyl-2-C-methyl-D-erythritol kinase
MVRIKSFAKINLGLEIIRKRDDGYHDLRTLFQAVDMFDILEFRKARSNDIHLEGTDSSIPWDETNLIFKAASLLKERESSAGGINIRVEKKIPAGMGLGGGSSNAAMTLYALNTIWALYLTKGELKELAKMLGADVPYFLEGGLCLGEERGDEITPLPDLNLLNCLLVLPDFSISTATVYGRYSSSLTSVSKDSKIIRFLERRELASLENDLEETVFHQYPQLQDIKSLFLNQGSDLALVSGSGSAVFGIFSDRQKAEAVWKQRGKDDNMRLVETLSRERYWSSLSNGV